MTLYGFYVEKDLPNAPGRKNQYYINTTSLEAAAGRAQNMFDFERLIHTTLVTFTNIHVWRVGSGRTDFLDIPVSDPGILSVSGAYNGPKQFLRLNLQSAVGYGGYKDYRLALGDNQVDGEVIISTVAADLASALDTYMPVILQLSTRSGISFVDAEWAAKVDYRQLSKSWYNRAQQ